MANFDLKQNDVVTLPFHLTDSQGRDVDLTGSDDDDVDSNPDDVTLVLYFTGNDQGDPAGTVVGYNDVPIDDYVDRPSGRVSHDFESDAFAFPGTYYIELTVNDGGEQQSYPKSNYFTADVDKKLATLTPGEIDSSGALTGDLNVSGFALTNIRALQFRDTGSLPDAPGEVQRNGNDIGIYLNGSYRSFLGGGGSGSGSADITDGTTTVTQPEEVTFTGTGGITTDVLDDGDNTATVELGSDITDPVVDSGDTFTGSASGLSGEPNTAARVIRTVTANETDLFVVDVYPDPNTTQPDEDYYFSYKATRLWKESPDDVKVEIEVFWADDTVNDVDGAPSADVEFKWVATDPTVGSLTGSGGTSMDITDGSTTVNTPTETTFAATDQASVTVNDDGDGTGTVTYDAPGPADVTDGSTTVSNPGQTTFSGSGSAAVTVSDNSGDAEVDINVSGGGGSGDGQSGINVDRNVSVSGDGSATSFTLSHSLGVQPAWVYPYPKTSAASTDFKVTGYTDTDVTIEYFAAPPSGTDNLTFDILTVALGGDLNRRDFSNSGTIQDGNRYTGLPAFLLANGESYRVNAATLLTDDFSAVPNGVDLRLVTGDGTVQTTVLSGDGSTKHVDVRGAPTAIFQKSTSGTAIASLDIVNNSGSPVDVMTAGSVLKIQ